MQTECPHRPVDETAGRARNSTRSCPTTRNATIGQRRMLHRFGLGVYAVVSRVMQCRAQVIDSLPHVFDQWRLVDGWDE